MPQRGRGIFGKGVSRATRNRRTPRMRGPQDLLLAALQTRWRVFLRQLGRCRLRCSEPAVHDLRVSTRRLIAALDLLAAVSPLSHAAKARQQLKRLLKSMGPLRDAQVQILAARRLSNEFPEIEPLSTVLMLREQRALKRIAVRLGRVQIRVLRQRVNAGIAHLRRLMRRASLASVLGLTLRGALAAEYVRVVQMRQQLDRHDPATIHRMRIAFKKFRYATEVLRPDLEARFHTAMNGLQNRMGDIHDLEVFRSSVREFAVQRRGRSATALTRTPLGITHRTRRSGRKPPVVVITKIERRLQNRHGYLVRRFYTSANEIFRFQELGSVG